MALPSLEDGHVETETQGECLMMKAAARKARDHQPPPEARKEQGRIFPCSFESQCGSADTVTLDFWLPEM